MSSSKAVGIDLGTTYSYVLYCDFSTFRAQHLSQLCWCLQNDRVEIIANDQGNRTTPSYVSFSDNERLIGDAAKNQVAMNPHNTYAVPLMPCDPSFADIGICSVFDAKRLIGRKFDDAEVQADLKTFSLHRYQQGGKPYVRGRVPW